MSHHRRLGPLLEKLIVLALVVPLLAFGAVALRAAMALDGIERGRSAGALTDEKAVAEIAAWNDWPGIGQFARASYFRITDGEVFLGSTLDPTRTFALNEPARTDAWLAYARASLAAGSSADKTDALLQQSYITGRYEGRLYFSRAIFAIAAWPVLEPETRKAAIRDFEQIRPKLWEGTYVQMSMLMRLVSPQTRDQIRAAIVRDDDVQTKEWFARLVGETP